MRRSCLKTCTVYAFLIRDWLGLIPEIGQRKSEQKQINLIEIASFALVVMLDSSVAGLHHMQVGQSMRLAGRTLFSPACIMKLGSKTWSCSSLAAGESYLNGQLEKMMNDPSVSLDEKIAATCQQLLLQAASMAARVYRSW